MLEGEGVYFRFKLGKKLSRKNMTNDTESHLTECKFAEDTIFLGTSKAGAEAVCVNIRV